MCSDDFTWTADYIKQLLELVKERPLLWSTDTKTSNRSTALRLERQQLWYEVAEKLGLPPDYAEKKTQVLKSQFNRETKRIRTAMKENKPVKHIWFGYSSLMFMIYNANDHDSIVEYIKDSKPTENTDHNDKTSISSELKKENGKELPQTEFCDINYESDNCKHQPSPKKKSKKHNKHHAKVKNKDLELYGSYVANKLSNIKNDYMRSLAQNEINNILAKAETGQL